MNNPNIETCDFYEGLDAAGAEGVMDPGVCVPSPLSAPMVLVPAPRMPPLPLPGADRAHPCMHASEEN